MVLSALHCAFNVPILCVVRDWFDTLVLIIILFLYSISMIIY